MNKKDINKIMSLEIQGDKLHPNNEPLFWIGNTGVGKGYKQNRVVLDCDIKVI